MMTSTDINRNPLEEMGIFVGMYPAVVEDNNDPNKTFRLRVRCDIVADKPLDWALPCGIPAGDGYGFFVLPQKGENVWISFQRGDMAHPVWQYGAVRTGKLPSEAAGSTILLASKNGTKIILHSSGKVEIKNDTESLGDVLTDFAEAVKGLQTLDSGGHTGNLLPASVTAFAQVITRLNNLLQ
jgi:hypothetical protein